jgi:hypothetical protein
VRQRTVAGARSVHHGRNHHTGERTMTKGQHGNKEAKKPKKVRVPNPPGMPESLAPLVAKPHKPGKR